MKKRHSILIIGGILLLGFLADLWLQHQVPLKTYSQKNPSGFSIDSVTFHQGGIVGNVVVPQFEVGEKIFWTLLVTPAPRVDPQQNIKIREALLIKDQTGKVIYQNPELVLIDEPPTDQNQAQVTFENSADLSGPGDYLLVLTISDVTAKEKIEKEIPIKVVTPDHPVMTQIKFHEKSPEDPEKNPPEFKESVSFFVSYDLYGLSQQNGNISFAEDLFVTDLSGKVLFEKEGILNVDDTWNGQDVLALNNQLSIPSAGLYRLRLKITDKFSNRIGEVNSDFSIIK